MAPTQQNTEEFVDDFEVIKRTADASVQEDNDAVTIEVARLHAALSDLQSRAADDTYATTLSISDLNSQLSQLAATSRNEFSATGVSVRDLRQLLDSLAERSEKRNITHDRRVRTLESSVDAVETGTTTALSAISGLKAAVAQESNARSRAVAGLRAGIDYNERRGRDTAERLDRMVAKDLPAIEAKLQDVEAETTQQHAELDSKLHDVAKRLDFVTASDLVDIRRIAAEASLRARLVEQSLPAVKADIYMAVADEIERVEDSARETSEAAAAELERLDEASEEVTELTQALQRRVQWTEDVCNFVIRRVVPRIQDEARKQTEALERGIRAAERREDALALRVYELENDAGRSRVREMLTDARLKDMEAAFSALATQVRKPAQIYDERVQDKAEAVPAILDRVAVRHLRKVLPRELRAEIERRQRRRAVPSVKALQTEILRRQMVRRAQRPKSMVSAFELQAEILRRSIKSEVARRRQTLEGTVKTPTGLAVAPAAAKSVNIVVKAIAGEVCTSVVARLVVPTFVSIRYLKQLIFFKTACTVHPATQSLVYAGQLLEDTWKVGGGRPEVSTWAESEDAAAPSFDGIKDNGVVLMVVKKD